MYWILRDKKWKEGKSFEWQKMRVKKLEFVNVFSKQEIEEKILTLVSILHMKIFVKYSHF